jgi:hypothetical protein
MTLVSFRPPPTPVSLLPAPGGGSEHEPDPPVPLWEDPAQEGYRLLGPAWRSSMPSPLQTGQAFDVVQVAEACAAPALEQLRRIGARRGAVFANDDQWHFFVPLESEFFPERCGTGWPAWVRYLSGAWITVPPRGARAGTGGLRWVTREPAGRLYTAPMVLWAALAAMDPPAALRIVKGARS